jgi:hypothetical protein
MLVAKNVNVQTDRNVLTSRSFPTTILNNALIHSATTTTTTIKSRVFSSRTYRFVRAVDKFLDNGTVRDGGVFNNDNDSISDNKPFRFSH